MTFVAYAGRLEWATNAVSVFAYLLRARYITAVIVVLALLDSVAFLVMGTLNAVKGYVHVLKGESGLGEERPGLELLHSLDFFFVSMVLLVLALGIAKLFLMHPTAAGENGSLPAWLQIDSISQLKVLLWETILTNLLIVSLADLTEGLFTKLEWTVLLTPVAILVLSLSLYCMKRA
jgi:uncharacterized membrane protein YqhA